MKCLSLFLVPLLLLAVRIAPASETAAASSMRCGNRLVLPGDSKYRVLQRCGEPEYRERISGYLERPMEQWFYYRGPQHFSRILTFDGNTLVRIELQRR